MTPTAQNIHVGKVNSVYGDKLHTTCSLGNQQCYTIAKDAKVMNDGKPCMAAMLKAGTAVRVTTHDRDRTMATVIESGKKIRIRSTAEAQTPSTKSKRK